ncbi:hypothetical protein [Paracoccus ravus]|uniref:hypothetical protein n=1 Tax=Paracoccus ravus TaxID=2447760 RepID=UPI003CC85637
MLADGQGDALIAALKGLALVRSDLDATRLVDGPRYLLGGGAHSGMSTSPRMVPSWC